MHDIDFLPAEYRQQHAQRKRQVWQVLVAVLFAGLIGLGVFSQHLRRRQLQAELAATEQLRQEAARQNDDLAELQSRLQVAQADADLFTYLCHPWPRTQILDALLAPLPDEITFRKLAIEVVAPAGQTPAERRSRTDKKTEEETLAKLPPATQDLKQLREDFDPRQTIVTIVGATTDSAKLHAYIGRLNRAYLFQKAEVDRIEKSTSDPEAAETFSATIIVRPGYAQPGGPTASNQDRPPDTAPQST